MKFKNIKLLIFFIVATSTIGCSIDQIEPINQLTEDNVVRDESSAESLLAAAYVPLRSDGLTNFYAGLMGASNEQVLGFFGGSTGFQENNVEDSNSILASVYTSYYTSIANANFLIDQLERGNAVGITDVRKNELISEAKAIRAFCHFTVLRQWGQFYNLNSEFGVVLRLEPSRDADPKARNTVQETYDAIVADLQFAITNGSSATPHYRFSAVAAQALLAKVYLSIGDYDNASSTALSVINNTDGYSLESNYGNIFQNNWGSEVLFSYFADNTTEASSISFAYNSFALSPSTYFRTIADKQDGIIGDGDPNTNATGYDSRFIYTYSQPTAGPNGIGKVPNGFFSSNANTAVFLRLGEQYLIYAEAETRRSGGDLNAALSMVNTIRTRAGMPVKVLTDQATLLIDIREEKMLELHVETAESWYDIVRYHILGDLTASSIKPTLTSTDKFIYPIASAALAGNNLLEQNPGY